MRNNNQRDYMVCQLTAHELIVAFHRHFHLLRENGVATIKLPGSRWLEAVEMPHDYGMAAGATFLSCDDQEGSLFVTPTGRLERSK
jgi:hypothetical protein